MAGPQEFTCRACGAQFDSREKLDKHNKREHSVSQADGAGDADRMQGQQGSRQEQQTPRGRSEPIDEDYAG
ncbi:MAG: hypothetical protein AB1762_06865 [Gemmatimonadota bacterium]